MTQDEFYGEATKRNIGIVSDVEQQTLRKARVAIVGMGGGGSYLTTLLRMGIGKFHIADFDTFSVGNFNRQAGASLATVDRPKTQVMGEIARGIHPDVQIREFGEGLGPHNVDEFLSGVDVALDAIDVFAQPARLLLYQTARRKGIPVLFGAPLGLSGVMSGFAPDGMKFEDYFDLHDGLSPFEIMMRFIVGLAPRGRHWTYMDASKVAPEDQTGPSSAAAIDLIAGMVATETLVALLKRRPLRVAPQFTQYDPYLARYWSGKLRWGNRGPLQRLKLWAAARKFGSRAADFNRIGFQVMPTGPAKDGR